MIMGKRALLFVVWFAVVASVGWCWGEDAAEMAKLAAGNMKVRVEEAKQRAAETVPDVKGSWADWAMNKLSEEFGSSEDSAKDAAQTIKENVKYAASKSTDTLNSAAYETSKYASEKANDAKDYASEKAGQAINTASDMANDAKEIVKDKANNAYKIA